MEEKTYAEKLKDPRWQKKRLEILNRDEWKCKACDDSKATLHIHHIAYNKGDPWDIKDHLLITLCESCHKFETSELGPAAQELINGFKNAGAMSYNLSRYSHLFTNKTREFFSYAPNFDILLFALNDKVSWDILSKACWKHLKENEPDYYQQLYEEYIEPIDGEKIH